MGSSNPFRKHLVKNFHPSMIQLVREHVSEGYSYGSFAGKYNISPAKWLKWTKEIPDLEEIRTAYNKKVCDSKKHPINK